VSSISKSKQRRNRRRGNRRRQERRPREEPTQAELDVIAAGVEPETHGRTEPDEDDDTAFDCRTCGGHGGGPDDALLCPTCRGSGVLIPNHEPEFDPCE
jgi:DnaJ-class molecular chaperone